MKIKQTPVQGKVLIRIVIATCMSQPLFSEQENQSIANEEAVELKPIVVTAPKLDRALEVVLDAKVAYQPIPAQDGADFLKSVPGFSIIRKGGTDGDPTLRGMAGSRLGISLDGQCLLGGCGNRMDPPTAYVFPSAYDRVTILKGPQSVLYGPGTSAGVVRFESDLRRLSARNVELDSNLTVGSFGRLDAAMDATVGNSDYFARVALMRTESSDYEDGAGNEIHSEHMRWIANAAFGWTPNDDTVLQFSAIRSDGEAAYADRAMDGVAFDRESYQFRFRRDYEGGLIERAELELGYNYIDHVMDNFSLRTFTPNAMMIQPTVSNPDRRTIGGRGSVELATSDVVNLSLGIDFQENAHSIRWSMNQGLLPYENMSRMRDAEFTQFGVFGEMTYELAEHRKLFAGLRLDDWRAEDGREQIRLGMMGSMPNPTAGDTRDANPVSGFIRFEGEIPAYEVSYYAGVGHAERFLDYWELIRNESEDSLSAFHESPEKTTQLDFGMTKRIGGAQLSLAAFLSDVDDFALVESGYAKPSSIMGTRDAVVTRGISARTWGGEAALSWRLDEHWLVDASLAYTRGENRTDDLALAQIAPLESRLSVSYTQRNWTVGGLLRAVDNQDRVAINQGNIVGQDIGPTSGFAVFSLNGSMYLTDDARLSAGVDNLFDEDYAEHISRAGTMIAGYPQTTRVNEPGRMLWARLDFSY